MDHAREISTLFRTLPVTCLEFIPTNHNLDRKFEILLAGVGPELRIFDLASKPTHFTSLKLLQAQRIYGIRFFGIPQLENQIYYQDIAVFGGRQYQVLRLAWRVDVDVDVGVGVGVGVDAGTERNRYTFTIKSGHSTSPPESTVDSGLVKFGSDWIFDLKYIHNHGNKASHLVLAYAHNYVEVVSLETFEVLTRFQNSVKCNLYCATIRGETLDNLTIASGTCFNQVILWEINANIAKNSKKIELEPSRTLLGHEGVIFGITFSQDGSRLVSTSDDRTIRVWDISDTQSGKYVCCAVLYGHRARVWKAILSDEYLISISEDCSCRVWLAVSDEASKVEYVPIANYSNGHFGKNIWSMAILNTEHDLLSNGDIKTRKKCIVATGGEDGGIKLWPLGEISNRYIIDEEKLEKLELGNLQYSSSLSNILVSERFEFPHSTDNIRNFVRVGKQRLLVLTDQGFLFHYNEQTNSCSDDLAHYKKFYRYGVMSASDCGKVVAIGCLDGEINLIVDNKIQFLRTHHVNAHLGTQIRFLKIFTSKKRENTFLLVSVDVKENVVLSTLALSKTKSITTTNMSQLLLPKFSKFSTIDINEKFDLLSVGTVNGALLIFHCDSSFRFNNLDNDTSKIHPVINWRRVHGNYNLSALKFTESSQNTALPDIDSMTCELYTGGRDGMVNKFRITIANTDSNVAHELHNLSLGDSNEPKLVISGKHHTETVVIDRHDNTTTGTCQLKVMSIEQLPSLKVTSGWVEKITSTTHLYCCCFYKGNFSVYNMNKQVEIFSIKCGGGHRRWELFSSDELDHIFSFVRKNDIFTFRYSDQSSSIGIESSIVQNSLLGKEIRSSCITSALSENKFVVACGGEEGILALATVDRSDIMRGNFAIRDMHTTDSGYPSASPISLNSFIPKIHKKCHTSVIKNLCWLDPKIPGTNFQYLLSAGGSEELYCWKVSADTKSLDGDYADTLDLNCHLVSKCPIISSSESIRITSITTFTINVSSASECFIACGYSDGFVRLWHLELNSGVSNDQKNRFSLISTFFNTNCVLSIANMVLKNNNPSINQPKIFIFFGDTLGRIKVVDASKAIQRYISNFSNGFANSQEIARSPQEDLPIVYNIDQVVQNGVNDIDVHLLTHLSKISVALAVAGEDDSVNFLVLSINDAEVKPLFSHKVPNAHFSSVQRLKFVSTGNQLLAISVATDQRVVLWRLAIHQSHMDVIKNHGTFNTIISDPSDMFLIKNTGEDSCCGVVVGIGLELFEFSKTLL